MGHNSAKLTCKWLLSTFQCMSKFNSYISKFVTQSVMGLLFLFLRTKCDKSVKPWAYLSRVPILILSLKLEEPLLISLCVCVCVCVCVYEHPCSLTQLSSASHCLFLSGAKFVFLTLQLDSIHSSRKNSLYIELSRDFIWRLPLPERIKNQKRIFN